MPEPPITDNAKVEDLDGRGQYWPNDRPDGPRFVWFEPEDICVFWAYRNHAQDAYFHRKFPALFHANDETGVAYCQGRGYKPVIRTWEEVIRGRSPH